MNLSPHFTLEELIHSQTADRKGLDNTPNAPILNNLTITAANLENVRKLLGNPISISSGYRSPAVNRAVGGVATSAHTQGWAVDFICPAFGSPKEIVDAIKAEGIKLDQCIEEGTWVHISFAPTMRNIYLKATFKNGVAQYTNY